MDLSRRHRQAELMDAPDLDPAEHARALRGLRRINRLSRTSATLWREVLAWATASSSRSESRPQLRILDVASGGGDVALGVARRARRAGMEPRLDGCDISPTAVELARQRAKADGADNVDFFALDVLREPLPRGYDVVTCSLFLHHLSDEQAVELLGKMAEAAGSLVLVNDLRRSRWGYRLAWLACRLLTRSHIVHVDGPLSVAAAFTADEALRLAQTAGLRGVTISHRWPQRFLLRWRRA